MTLDVAFAPQTPTGGDGLRNRLGYRFALPAYRVRLRLHPTGPDTVTT